MLVDLDSRAASLISDDDGNFAKLDRFQLHPSCCRTALLRHQSVAA
jgi:hypothetical protein